MTNYEKIKSMTIEEMAEAIDENGGLWCECCAFTSYSEECNSKTCREGYIKWFNQEVEE